MKIGCGMKAKANKVIMVLKECLLMTSRSHPKFPLGRVIVCLCTNHEDQGFCKRKRSYWKHPFRL